MAGGKGEAYSPVCRRRHRRSRPSLLSLVLERHDQHTVLRAQNSPLADTQTEANVRNPGMTISPVADGGHPGLFHKFEESEPTDCKKGQRDEIRFDCMATSVASRLSALASPLHLDRAAAAGDSAPSLSPREVVVVQLQKFHQGTMRQSPLSATSTGANHSNRGAGPRTCDRRLSTRHRAGFL